MNDTDTEEVLGSGSNIKAVTIYSRNIKTGKPILLSRPNMVGCPECMKVGIEEAYKLLQTSNLVLQFIVLEATNEKCSSCKAEG